MLTKEQFIVEVWERTAKDIVGAAELTLIQDAVSKRFGMSASVSPASIARVLADHGARLGHPEILQTDARWREQQLFEFFTADELAVETMGTANTLIEKIERLRREFTDDESRLERLRFAVRKIKTELDALAASKRANARRELARELAQWLNVWLQNPQIFGEWLSLRRSTPEFQELFTS